MEYKVVDNIMTDKVGEELVLTLPRGNMVVLNGSATVVFNAIASCDINYSQVAAAADSLQDAYGIERDLAIRDARKVISWLHSTNIIVPRCKPFPKQTGPYKRITRRVFVAGMAAAGLSLLDSNINTALGEESSKVAEKVYKGATLVSIDEKRGKRVWRDSLKRSVELPNTINKVAPYGPYAQALLESIDQNMVVQATARGMHASIKSNAAIEAKNLTKDTGSTTALSKTILRDESPDIILDVAVSEEMLCTAVDITADDAGVPICHLVIKLGELPQAYRTLGKLLRREDQCNEIADYIASIEVTLAQLKEQTPSSNRKRVYLGGFDSRLTKYACNSVAGDIIEKIGAINVATTKSFAESKTVSMESIVLLNPNLLIMLGVDESSTELCTMAWSIAFESKDVEVIPLEKRYENAFQRTPLLLQTAGSLILASLIYPDMYSFNVEAWNASPLGMFAL